MSVTEIKQAMGSWSLALKDITSRSILDALTVFGHVALIPGEYDVAQYGDNLLTKARYVGVYRGRENGDGYTLSGSGMAFWLGDEDDKGDIFESAVTLNAATFAASINALLPPGGAVTAGVIGAVAGTYSGSHRWETPRKSLTYVTDTFSTPSAPVEWIVTGDGKLNAGLVSDFFVTNPRALIMRGESGRDLNNTAIPGTMSLGKDSADYTTRVVLLGEGDGGSIATGSADAVGVTAKDIHGNTVKFTRLTSESDTSGANAAARAQLMLNRFSSPTSSVELSVSPADIKGDFVVGDYINVYDPNNGFVDPSREVFWEGDRINPVKLRCVEMTWPIPDGFTVAFRDTAGNWIDLTPWYLPESGDTTVVVGSLDSDLAGLGGAPIGDRAAGDSSVPASPALGSISSVAYQSAASNDVRTQAYLTWTQPLNTNGSTIVDGDHYEIRVRAVQTFNYQITWAQAAGFRWNQMQTWGRPLSNPAATANEWKAYYVGFDRLALAIQELMVSTQYEFQIRAVDTANPPNYSAWSASSFYTTITDTLAPDQPAVPEVASSLIAIQVVHRLGAATGGTFNLAQDLHHLEVHVGGQFMVCSEATRVGTLIANSGHINGKIPVVGTFPVPNTGAIWVKVIAVDKFGNKSSASDSVQSAAILIDSAHISDLTASKITAGIITADILMSGAIKTAADGQRVELNAQGVQLFDDEGNLTVNLTADDATPNFISIQDPALGTVASIDSTGNIQGQVFNAANDVIIAGDSFLTDLYDPLPKGIVAYGEYPKLATEIPGAGVNVEKGAFELSFVARAGRLYRVTVIGQVSTSFSGTTAEQFTYRLRDNLGATPDLSSTEVFRAEFYGPMGTSSGYNTGNLIYEDEFTAGLHRLLLTFTARYGTATLRTGNQPWVWTIEDIGSSALVPNTLILNDGSGGSTTSVTKYEKAYPATWSRSYTGGGSASSFGGAGRAYQGDSGDSNGNRKSLIGFDWSRIMSDLTGATITKCELKLYFQHWWYDAGGTAILGTHSYTGSSGPSTYPSSSANTGRKTVTGWPKPGLKTVDLGTTIGDEFRTGASRGIAIGPGASSSLTYYGYASGYGETNPPQLIITYTK